jgi:hypothetical protein
MEFEARFASQLLGRVSDHQDRAAGALQQLKMGLITRGEAKRFALMLPIGAEMVAQYLPILGGVGNRGFSRPFVLEGQRGPVPLERCLAAVLDVAAKLACQPQGRLLPRALLSSSRLECHRLVDHPHR